MPGPGPVQCVWVILWTSIHMIKCHKSPLEKLQKLQIPLVLSKNKTMQLIRENIDICLVSRTLED